MIAIESKTQGNHKEHKILVQNCLISLQFNQKLSLQIEEHIFIEKIYHDKRGPSDSLKDDWTAGIVRI